jgi:hypothetical protein
MLERSDAIDFSFLLGDTAGFTIPGQLVGASVQCSVS